MVRYPLPPALQKGKQGAHSPTVLGNMTPIPLTLNDLFFLRPSRTIDCSRLFRSFRPKV